MDYRKLIADICIEEGIEYNLISKDWVMVLTKNGITECIFGYRFPLNNHSLGSVIDDKYAFYDLCRIKKIPIIEHKILFNPSSKFGKDTFNLANKYFKLYKENVVIKPNNGTEGNDVYHITDKNEYVKILNKMFKTNFSLSICPYYVIEKEYRVVVLNDNVKLIYEKNIAKVIGDGIKTIKQLLTELNPNYFTNLLNENKYNKILSVNEVYEYDWRFNLSKGATAKLVTNKDLYNKLSILAIQICKTIQAKFVTVDIIECNNKFYVMEVNSGVCINKVCNFIDKDLQITKQIYREAVLAMFDK